VNGPSPTREQRLLQRLFYKAKESVNELERLMDKLPEKEDRREAERQLASLSDFIKEVEGE
jgi:hypothetical protein